MVEPLAKLDLERGTAVMISKPRFVTTLGLAGALLAGSIAVVAQVPSETAPTDAPARAHHGKGNWHHGKGFGKGRARHGGQFGRALDLTEEQRAKVRSIMEAERAKNAPLRQQLAENHRALQAATKAGSFDEAQVRTLAQQAEAARVELAVSRARVQSAIYTTVLTQEQRAKLDEFAAKRQARRAETAKPGDAK
jgi:Spy/CpxP family protein refolding chaperone